MKPSRENLEAIKNYWLWLKIASELSFVGAESPPVVRQSENEINGAQKNAGELALVAPKKNILEMQMTPTNIDKKKMSTNATTN